MPETPTKLQDGARSARPIRRDTEYYLPDSGMAIFKVENRLYKVHRYFFIRESSVFQSMFDCPHPPEGQDGDSDARPIHLPQVTCAEFEALLNFFYYGMFESKGLKPPSPGKPNNDPLVRSSAQAPPTFAIFNEPSYRTSQNLEPNNKRLYDLLSISLRYAFDRVIKDVVAVIDAQGSNADPISKMLLGLKHEDLRKWVQPAFEALIERSTPLTRDDVKNLGPTRTAIICEAREKRAPYSQPQTQGGPFAFASSQQNTRRRIPEEFYGDDSF